MPQSEIRIINPEKKLLEALKKAAKEDRRTIGKQAEEMIDYALLMKGYYKKNYQNDNNNQNVSKRSF